MQVTDDLYYLNLLTSVIQIKDNSVFAFVRLFDVWVNLIVVQIKVII